MRFSPCIIFFLPFWGVGARFAMVLSFLIATMATMHMRVWYGFTVGQGLKYKTAENICMPIDTLHTLHTQKGISMLENDIGVFLLP